jgi:serine/threonine protein kinase
MKYAAFQRVVHSTEPRGVVIFTAPFVDIMPHIAAQAEGVNVPVKVYARGQLVHAAGNLDPDVVAKAEAEGVFNSAASSKSAAFPAIVTEMLDMGGWLVLPDPTEIDITIWREVAKILLLATPEVSNFMTRRHFRLFTFVSQGVALTQTLPPLICQFAFVVDNSGAVKTRSQLGPLFEGSTTMQGFRALADFSKADADIQNNNYVQLLVATMKSNIPDDDARVLSTDPVYVNEVLFKLREQLLDDQHALLDAARKEDADAEATFELQVERNRERLGDDYDEQRDRHDFAGRVSAEKKLRDNYDWVFHKTLSWVVAQCPDADLSTVPTIPNTEVEVQDVLWVREFEECHSALWNGCDVLSKRPQTSLVQASSDRLRKLFEAEAARHAPLRHPFVVGLYGVVASSTAACDRVILEPSDGTLEQRLITARFEAQHWRVADFLDMAADVLRGMGYLSTQLIHRDISPRSVLRCKGTYKVGQFGCSIPLNFVETEAKRGFVPVRWTAPEGFTGQFCPASDMWAFGLLLWQAVQYVTIQPYSDCENVPDAVLGGAIPSCPRECPEFLYDVIVRCLNLTAADRPTPTQCLLDIQHLKRTLPPVVLDCPVPFLTDDASFAEFNSVKLQGGRSFKNAGSFRFGPGSRSKSPSTPASPMQQ